MFFGFGILNIIYAIMTQYTYDEAYKQVKDKTAYSTDANSLMDELDTEWNSYMIEDIVTAITVTPMIPYWYAAQGKCEGDEWHYSCPEEGWDRDLIREEDDEDRERREDREDMDRRREREDYEMWEEESDEGECSDPEEDEDEEFEDEIVPEPENLSISL